MKWSKFIEELDKTRSIIRASRDIKTGDVAPDDQILVDLGNVIRIAVNPQLEKPEARPIQWEIKELPPQAETVIHEASQVVDRGDGSRMVVPARPDKFVPRKPELIETDEKGVELDKTVKDGLWAIVGEDE